MNAPAVAGSPSLEHPGDWDTRARRANQAIMDINRQLLTRDQLVIKFSGEGYSQLWTGRVIILNLYLIKCQFDHLISIRHPDSSLKFWIDRECWLVCVWEWPLKEVEEVFLLVFFNWLSCDNEGIHHTTLSPCKELLSPSTRDFSDFTKNLQRADEFFSFFRVIEVWYFEFHIILRHLRGELSWSLFEKY